MSSAKRTETSHHPTSKKRSTSKPKPPLSPAERTTKLFGTLCSQLDGEHFENSLKTCNKLLALDPSDGDILQTKLWLLFKLSDYSQALQVTESDGTTFGFERAYALYRLQRETEAAEVLKGLDKSDRSKDFLLAQILYRQGNYSESLQSYNALLETPGLTQEEYEDIQVNMRAAETHIEFNKTGYLTAVHKLPQLPNRQVLEDAPLPALQAATHFVATDTVESNEPLKPKPPRKRRIPKGVVPGVTPPPDPERWLKKSERTRVETGKKKKGGGATQGASVSESKQGGGGGGKKKKK